MTVVPESAFALLGLDFADALHLLASSRCTEFLSFDDRKFARRAKRLGVAPAVVVPTK